MARWKRKDVLLLIEMYKQNNFLYDRSHRDYCDPFKTDLLFSRMNVVLKKTGVNVTVDEIKRKIKHLRYQYAHEKSQFEKFGAFWNYGRRLWCYEMLQFLDPHLRNQEDHAISAKQATEQRPASSLTDPQHVVRSSRGEADETGGSKGNARDSTPLSADATAGPSQDPSVGNASDSPPPPGAAVDLGREDAFARFVAMELKQIGNLRVYNETKWKIQLALMEGIRKQLAESEEEAASDKGRPSRDRGKECTRDSFIGGMVKEEVEYIDL